jgi:hypothetical protein
LGPISYEVLGLLAEQNSVYTRQFLGTTVPGTSGQSRILFIRGSSWELQFLVQVPRNYIALTESSTGNRILQEPTKGRILCCFHLIPAPCNGFYNDSLHSKQETAADKWKSCRGGVILMRLLATKVASNPHTSQTPVLRGGCWQQRLRATLALARPPLPRWLLATKVASNPRTNQTPVAQVVAGNKGCEQPSH